MPTVGEVVNINKANQYGYKMPAVASQSKIMSMGNVIQNSSTSQQSGLSTVAAYRKNTRKFVHGNNFIVDLEARGVAPSRGTAGTSPDTFPLNMPMSRAKQRRAAT